jgi:hypothetical protein
MKNISVDLHGMTADEGKSSLLRLLKSCPADTEQIEVIHGCHRGTVLLDMVRSLKHPRIDRKILGLNNGVTVILLKKPSDVKMHKKIR